MPKFVVVNGMLPVPPQVVGLTAVPATKVGADGSVSVFVVLSLPVQPALVMLNSEYVPCVNPLKVKVLEAIVILAVWAVVPFL